MGFVIRSAGNKVRPLVLIVLLLSVSFIGSCSGGGGGGGSAGNDSTQIVTHKNDKHLIGAHYYVWWPSNFDFGYLRAKLDPPQTPELGVYDSSDPKVAEQHIAWASRYGIDFFTLDWWPTRPEQNRAIAEGFLKAGNIGDIKFALFYESYEQGALGPAYEHGSVFTESFIETFVTDVVALADQFFDHPSYLKVDGRPVLFFYLVRNYTGDYQEAFRRIREGFAAKGYNPYLIADEVFWDVTKANVTAEEILALAEADPTMSAMPVTNQPQTDRIKLFDAITSYNMYNWAMYSHAGYGADSTYVADVSRIWDEYLGAMDDGVDFIPNLLTGYNDRGIRPGEDHYAIPRQWKEGDSDGTFLAESFDRLGFPYSDPDVSMVLITSWNEWNEDTNIEPVTVAAATSLDETGGSLTQGFSYPGYGTTALEAVQNKVSSVAGRVTDQAGAAIWGSKVCGYKDQAQITCSTTNREGYYTLSRLKMPADEYDVALEGKGGSILVSVDNSKTITDLNFTR